MQVFDRNCLFKQYKRKYTYIVFKNRNKEVSNNKKPIKNSPRGCQ